MSDAAVAPPVDASSAEGTSASSAAPIRMKKIRKRAAVRSGSAADGGDDDGTPAAAGGDEDGSSADPASNLHTIRLMQKLRSKSAAALSLGESDLHLPDAATNAAADSAASASSAAASASVVGKEFGAEGSDAQAALIDQQMEAYIAEQMAARRALRQPQKQTQAAAAAPAVNLSEDQLFVTPEHLKIKSTQSVEEVEESGERWLTGIAECTVSIKDKMANIEKTEIAKAKLMREQMTRKEAGQVLPANYNANFRLHKKEWDGKRREEFRMFHDSQNRQQALAQGLPAPPPSQPWTRDVLPNPATDPRALPGFLAGPEEQRRDFLPPRPNAAGRGGGQRASGVPNATDDRAVDRFLKRQRYK